MLPVSIRQNCNYYNAANCTEHFMNSEFMLLFSFVLLFCHVFSQKDLELTIYQLSSKLTTLLPYFIFLKIMLENLVPVKL